MKFFILGLMLLVSSVEAEVSKSHVDEMLNQMVRDNVISATEAEKARYKLKSLSSAEWKAINKQATTIASRMPASANPVENKIENVNKIDLDREQFMQIQADIKKIMPRYNP